MPETKLIPTVTTSTVVNSIISIFTEFLLQPPFTIIAFISEIVASKNGTSFIEGDLVITMTNSPEKIDYFLDSLGNLIVNANSPEDAAKYSIDSNGDLIYTF